MKEIALTQGKIALVDDEDFERLSKWKWYAHKGGYEYYAVRNWTVDGKRGSLFMHRAILQPPADKDIDHANHNGLDNQKSNLRVVATRLNVINQRKQAGTSQYKGVCLNTSRRGIGKWRAQIQLCGKKSALGLFDSELEAALVYDNAARRLFGEFACVNFPAAGERSCFEKR